MSFLFKNYKICKLFGIDVFLNGTMMLFIAILYIPNLFRTGFEINKFILELAIFVGLFISVLLHELGHCLEARRHGLPTKDIILTPIGGLAQIIGLENLKPKKEFLIAFAGPAVSYVLSFLFAGIFMLLHKYQEIDSEFLAKLAMINFVLGTFNLIPALPMDGGRIFRAGLSHLYGKTKATKIAYNVSKVFAILFVIGGFVIPAPSLFIIGFFLFLASMSEVPKDMSFR